MRSLLLLISLLGLACAGQKAASNEKGNSSEQDSMKLQLVLQDSYSGIEQPEFQVIRGPKALKNLFLKFNRTRKPGLPVPEVDFTQEILLVYCAGATFDVGIKELVILNESLESITIGQKEQTTSKKENLNSTITPFLIYKMPFTQKEINLLK